MKKLLKKVLCLSLVAIIALFAVGCGSNSSKDENDGGNSSSKLSTDNTTDDVVDISKYGYTDNPDGKTLAIHGIKDGKSKILDIPSEIKGKTVTEIEENAFYSSDNNIEEIIVPSTVEKIGDYAFDNIETLKKITLSEGVKEIGQTCFGENTSLTEINLPSSLKVISVGAFGLCPSLEKVTIPEGVERIEANAFVNCEKLKEIHIPSSVTFIQNESEEASSAFKSYSTESGIINVTIYAPKGSYAEKYAKQENIKFVAE